MTATWKYKYLDVENFGSSHQLTAKKFSPLMPRLLGELLFGSNFNPQLLVNFQQWNEDITINCFKGSISHDEQGVFASDLRAWIMKAQGSSFNKLYLQPIIDVDTGDNKFDNYGYPWTMVSNRGFEGIVTGLNFNYNAAEQALTYNIKFTVGWVLII